MKISEGKVYELDPTKWYWFVVKAGSLEARHIRKRDGVILYPREVDDVKIIENADRLMGVATVDSKQFEEL